MWFNPIVRSLLRSPLHGIMSRYTLLMTYTGRKSGYTYTTPMNYVRSGGRFYVTSLRTHTWWRNLRGKVQVALRVRGQDLQAYAQVIEDEAAVVDELRTYFRVAPRLARSYGVTIAPGGEPDAEDLAPVANRMVVVRADLLGQEKNSAQHNPQNEKSVAH